MKIEVVWKQPGGSVTALPSFSVNPADPHINDEELQIAKAKAAAQVLIREQFGDEAPAEQLSIKVVRE